MSGKWENDRKRKEKMHKKYQKRHKKYVKVCKMCTKCTQNALKIHSKCAQNTQKNINIDIIMFIPIHQHVQSQSQSQTKYVHLITSTTSLSTRDISNPSRSPHRCNLAHSSPSCGNCNVGKHICSKTIPNENASAA